MSFTRRDATSSTEETRATTAAPMPGKQTLVQAIQRVAGAEAGSDASVHAAAARGTASPATALPYREVIQQAFGRHDVSDIQAHAGGDATKSAQAMGAGAYATGNHVVLGDRADLHTVAHEAAHVVQQRGGVQLKGGVGAAGDKYEQHADRVADLVVQGKSAEAALDGFAGSGSPASSSSTADKPVANGGGAQQLQHAIARLQALIAGASPEDPESAGKCAQLTSVIAQLRGLAASGDDAQQAQAAQQIAAGLGEGEHAAAAPVQHAPVQRDGGGAEGGQGSATGLGVVIAGAIALGTWLLYRNVIAPRQQRTSDRDTLAPSFNAKPPEAAPGRDAIFASLRDLTARRQLSDLPRIRDLADMLTQYVSDGLMRLRDPAFVPLKQAVIDAAVAFQQAFLVGASGNAGDYRAHFTTGCDAIDRIDSGLITQFQEAVVELGEGGAKVKPNKREVNMFNQGRLDLASMMLAKAAHKDGFVPHLVVGLPSGGAHVATRVAATLGAIAGATPVTWMTRPRTVKPERQGLMGDGDVPMVMDEEHALLRQRLGIHDDGEHATNILIVDDGQESGETLRQAVAHYRASFPGSTVRGAVTFGGTPLLEDQLNVRVGDDVEQRPNAGHYMVHTSYNAAGRRAPLKTGVESGEIDPPEHAPTNSAGSTMATQVTIVTADGQFSYPARDLLTNK